MLKDATSTEHQCAVSPRRRWGNFTGLWRLTGLLSFQISQRGGSPTYSSGRFGGRVGNELSRPIFSPRPVKYLRGARTKVGGGAHSILNSPRAGGGSRGTLNPGGCPGFFPGGLGGACGGWRPFAASDNSCYRKQFFRGLAKARSLKCDVQKLRAQIRYIRSGRTSLLFAVRGKCCASLFPHTLIAVIKPSAIRPSRMCATSASTAACHSDWGT